MIKGVRADASKCRHFTASPLHKQTISDSNAKQ